MPFFERIMAAVKEDLGALVPGGKSPLDTNALLRLFLYLCLLLFIFRLFFAAPGASEADFFQWEPERKEIPRPEGRERPGVENPRNI